MTAPKVSSVADAAPQMHMPATAPELHGLIDQFFLLMFPPRDTSRATPSIASRPIVVFASDGIRDTSVPGFPEHYSHHLATPTAGVDILVHLRYPDEAAVASAGVAYSPYACVFMPMRRTIGVAFRTPSYFLGIRFCPGAARDFLGRSIHTLADVATPLEEVWGSHGRAFVDALSRSSDLVELNAIAERHLLARWSGPSEETRIVRRCAEALWKNHGSLSIEELRAIAGLSERRLERLFQEYVGMSPKRLARTMRWDYLLQAVRNLDAIDWHELVVTLDYCDQPHLIREFKDFLGMTPAAFRERMKRHLEQEGNRGAVG
jgi:AraC-like DNA-binding protein